MAGSAVVSSNVPMVRLMSSRSAVRIDTTQGEVGGMSFSVGFAEGSGLLELAASPPAGLEVVELPMQRGRNYAAVLRTTAGLPAGQYLGSLTVRACAARPCAGDELATISIPYRINVGATRVVETPGEWATFQADMGHTGYLPVHLDTGKWRTKWTWTRPTSGPLANVVTEGGRVFITERLWNSVAYVNALDERTGTTVWSLSYPNLALGPATVANGRLYTYATGSPSSALLALDTSNGEQVYRTWFGSGYRSPLAPAVRDGIAYPTVESYYRSIRAVGPTGSVAWQAPYGDLDIDAVALDGTWLYHYDGDSLNVIDPKDGSVVKSIADPYASPSYDTAFVGAPIVTSPGNVMAFSGKASAYYGNSGRLLVNYSIAEGKARWRSARPYVTHAATGDGVIVAGSNAPFSLDVLSESTGQLLWSWAPPANDYSFLTSTNVVLTKNLAFVSTGNAVYGIDLVTRRAVWSFPVPGHLSLSPSGTLFVMEPFNGEYANTHQRVFAIGGYR
ncbi:hypothetical protein GCM10027188_09320 [Lysobacter humi (ex Lee et al. 2017)]